MHPSSEPLLKTKLLVPQARSRRVYRARLTERLNAGLERPLTLVAAPAGFGKTTLLVDWANQTGLPVAWLSLEPDDNDPARLFTYLVAALQTCRPGVGQSALTLLQSLNPMTAETGAPSNAGSGSISIEPALKLLVNDLTDLDQDLALVLDDCHVLNDPVVYDLLRYLVEHLPPRIHLLLASRTEPPLPLGRLRARDQMVELRTDDLRFTDEEASSFLRQVMGLTLSTEELSRLENRTEGWVAGLQFAALASQGGMSSDRAPEITGSHPYVLDYLAEEVLRRQPTGIQHFLLSTSILERFCSELCAAVLGDSSFHCQQALESLEKSNLFLTALDDTRTWFRYHALFAEFLRSRLQRSFPAAVPELHHRAAHWFQTQGLHDEAFKHALSAGDVDLAADLIEETAELRIKRGEFRTMISWVAQLPPAVLQRRPRLRIVLAWAYAANFEIEKAEDALLAFERVMRDSPTPNARWSSEGAAVQALIAAFRGQPQRSFELARQALDGLPEENAFMRSTVALIVSFPHLFSGDTHAAIRALEETIALARRSDNLMIAVVAYSQLGETYIAHGELEHAFEAYSQAARIATDPQTGQVTPLTGLGMIGMGDVLRERNDLTAARQYLEQGIELGHLWQSFGAFDGYISLARLEQSEGNDQKAVAIMRHALDVAHDLTALHLDDWIAETYIARLHLMHGSLEWPERWAREHNLLYEIAPDFPENFTCQLHEHLHLTCARLHLHLGYRENSPQEFHAARRILEDLLAELEPLGRYGVLIELRLILAQVLIALGETESAQQVLGLALSQARPEGYARIFLDEGPRLAVLLRQRLDRPDLSPAERDYILRLLELGSPARQSQPSPVSASLELDSLTRRELDILQLMADGASNQEIADQLVLSLNTVKKHVANILSKFAVANRTQAVRLARQKGLL